MRQILLPALIATLWTSAVFAEFPGEITVGDKALPVRTCEEMRKMGFECEDIPWKDNAARLYIEAMNAIVPMPDELDRNQEFLDAQKKLDLAGYSKQLDQWLADNRRAFELLEEADRVEKCAFPVHKAENAAAILLPQLSELRNLARMLQYRAAYRFSKGEYAAAVDDGFRAMRMGERSGHHPMLISWLVGVAIEGIGENSLDRIVITRKLDEKTLAGIAARLDGLRPLIDDFPRALRNERMWALQVVEDLKRDPGALAFGEMPLAQRIAFRMTFHPETTRKNLEAAYDFLENRAKGPVPDAFKPENSFGAYMRKHAAEWDWVTRLLMPALDRAQTAAAKHRMSHELLQIRVALERHRLANNEYPEKLDALAPKYLPRALDDPFSGKPFRYERTEDGFRAWSVGEDLVDDHAKTVYEAGADETSDYRITQDLDVFDPTP